MPVTAPNDRPPAGGASAHLPVDPTGDDPGLERRLRAADPLAGVLPDDASTGYVGNQAQLTLCRANELHDRTALKVLVKP